MDTRISAASRLALLLALVLGLALAPARAEEDLGTLYTTFPSFDGLTRVEVREVIVASLIGRQWEVRSQSDERVVGYINRRANEATVTFILKDDGVDFYCLGYVRSEYNGAKTRKLPTGWLENLKKDIPVRAAARAAAE